MCCKDCGCGLRPCQWAGITHVMVRPFLLFEFDTYIIHGSTLAHTTVQACSKRPCTSIMPPLIPPVSHQCLNRRAIGSTAVRPGVALAPEPDKRATSIQGHKTSRNVTRRCTLRSPLHTLQKAPAPPPPSSPQNQLKPLPARFFFFFLFSFLIFPPQYIHIYIYVYI